MGVERVASSDYEAEANRLRARMSATIGELQSNLTPSNLASEAAARAGIADLSWTGAFAYASRKHPIPTAVIGLGLALLTMSAIRRRTKEEGLASLALPLRDSSSSIVESAASVFRERAEAKRREFVGAAQAQVAAGASKLSDEIEKRLEDVIDRVPGGFQARPLIESALQIAITAALEGLLQKRPRYRSRQA